jgi:CheY-like chemotaxis protein
MVTKLLLIEDNQADVDLVSEMLTHAGMQTEMFTAPTLFEASQFLEEREVDLVLLDLSLPDSHGYQTLSNFIKKHPRFPVIVLTGTNNDIVGNQSIKAGAQDFLIKGQTEGRNFGRAKRYALERFKNKEATEKTVKAVKQSNRQLEEAQRMIGFGNWEMDPSTNKMTWSDAVFQIFGFQPGSFHPTLSDYLRYVHNEDALMVENFYNDTPNKTGTQTLEHRLVVDGKHLRHVLISARIEINEDQDIRLVGGMQDITERKNQELQLVEEMMARKATSIKDEVLADMSFHIRTQLSSVVQLSYLLEQGILPGPTAELVRDLRRSTDDLSSSLSNLLNFTLLISDQSGALKETFYPADMLGNLNHTARIKSEAVSVHFELEPYDQLPERLLGDFRKINQVVYNLVEYATASVHTGHVCSLSCQIQVQASPRTQSMLQITLKTTHSPLPVSRLKELISVGRIIEGLNTDTKSHEKLFLPIAIASMLTDRMNGQFALQSRGQLKGYIITAEIPVEVLADSTSSDTTRRLESICRILLVEDHYISQIATRKTLTAWSDKITVDIAENGMVGVEKCRANPYDLIIMDIQMPVMNGFEATKRIRETHPLLPIIALTANVSRQEADKCISLGFNDYLGKPFKPQDLFDKILAAL